MGILPRSHATSNITAIAVVNKRRNVYAPFSYVEAHGYGILVVHSIPELIKAMTIARPKAVLLSWNLKGIDLKKMYTLLSDRFKIPCIVFPEELTRQTNKTLMASGITDFLLSPVSGPSLLMRLRAFATAEKKARAALFQTDEPLENLDWDQKTNPANPHEKNWHGKNGWTKNFGGYYFFKGAKVPKYNAKEKKWYDENGLETGSQVRFIKSDSKRVANEFEAALSKQLDAGFDSGLVADEMAGIYLNLIEPVEPAILGNGQMEEFGDFLAEVKSDVAEKQFPLDEKDVDLQPVSTTENQDHLSLLARAVKFSYLKNAQIYLHKFNESTEVSKITLSTISSPRFHGYLICVTATDEHQAATMQKANDVIVDEMGSFGEVVMTPIQVMQLEVDQVNFLEWARLESDFFVTSKMTGIAMAFFSCPYNAELEERDDRFALMIERDLTPGAKISFDLYMHMPKNKKYLKYLKRGQVFSHEMRDKFMVSGVKELHVDSAEINSFYSYAAENFLQSTLRK